jgi:hypothetical protein
MRAILISVTILIASHSVYAAGLVACGMGKSNCRELIGKRLWVIIPKWNPNNVEVTQTPGNWKRTLKLRSGSFLVKGVIPDRTFGHDFFVELQNGKTGYISADSFIFLRTYDPVAVARQKAEECQRRGQPKIGMTVEQAVATCWGKPRRVVKVTTAAGVRLDYFYPRSRVLRFESGKLSAILEESSQ